MSAPLASEQLQRLLPTLGHLAEMVKKAGKLDRESLRLLLIGSGLQEECAERELERWVDILVAARAASGPIKREIARRALMLRGIPEAPAALAVSVVAEEERAEPPQPLRSLRASVASLDLGTLAPSQRGTAEFQVEGGPGQILAESDQVVVTPRDFGAGTTRVRVEVRPSQTNEVKTKLRLVTARETLEIPLVAQWKKGAQQATLVEPAIGPSPASSAGTADREVISSRASLEEAIKRATPGATLHLEAGTYRLARPLTINKSLALIGMGMEKTRIVCDGEAHVVRFAGEGTFIAADLTFAHEGKRWAHVVEAVSGEMRLTRCCITGGIWDRSQQRGGSGLHLSGRASGIVSACSFIRNDGDGILMQEQAQATLEDNKCESNNGNGIAYIDNTYGKACKNCCNENGKNGILVSGNSWVDVKENTCLKNKDCGIVYFGNTKGEVYNNKCKKNGAHGIFVGKEAQLLWIALNECCDNKGSGIVCHGSVSSEVEGNFCSYNKYHGTYVAPTAKLKFRNTAGYWCHDNKREDVKDDRRS